MPVETVDAALDDLIRKAHEAPVTVLRNGKPAAIVLSPEDYDRLDGPERMRRKAALELIEIMKQIHGRPENQALTDQEVDELLADAS
jgi:prevent-host-death family protein